MRSLSSATFSGELSELAEGRGDNARLKESYAGPGQVAELFLHSAVTASSAQAVS